MTLTPSPTREFLSALGDSLDRPRPVLAVSAHFIAEEPTLISHANPPTVHDFRGFSTKLYEMTYPAPGEPGLAQGIAERITNAGMPTHLDPHRGLDHGAWPAIRLMYPGAEIPVVQLSLVRSGDAGYHYRLGQALRGLAAQGLLVLGSGGMSHNLRARDWKSGARPSSAYEWAKGFTDWFADRAEAGDTAALVDYRRGAPHASENHPAENHLLPFFVALGASESGRGRLIHAATQMRPLAMDAYAFD